MIPVSISLHRIVDTLVDFEPIYHFFVIVITVQIQHYCLYSDSPTLITPYDAQASSALI